MTSALFDDLGVGLLVLARVAAMIQVAPLFSSAAIPQPGKIGLALFVAMIALPGVAANGYPVPASGMQFGLLLIGEALLGVLLGLLAVVGFAALRTAGQFISLPIGFGIAELLDPFTERGATMLGALFHLLALLAFLSVGGLHRLLLDGVAGSFHVLRAADLVVLAIKPQDLPHVSQGLRGQLFPAQTAVSIIAGAKMSTLADSLGHAPVIRVMPNTPAQIGQGMSLWTASNEVAAPAREMTQSILATVGQEIYVADEKYLDMATALSASGPAYVFMIIEALIDAGVYVGLPRDMSRALALQMVYGSTRLVMETGKHPGELKDMVVSPGGTTAEGLQALEQAGVPGALVAAVNAAYLKSVRLGQT